jgi:hypothetical protein
LWVVITKRTPYITPELEQAGLQLQNRARLITVVRGGCDRLADHSCHGIPRAVLDMGMLAEPGVLFRDSRFAARPNDEPVCSANAVARSYSRAEMDQHEARGRFARCRPQRCRRLRSHHNHRRCDHGFGKGEGPLPNRQNSPGRGLLHEATTPPPQPYDSGERAEQVSQLDMRIEGVPTRSRQRAELLRPVRRDKMGQGIEARQLAARQVQGAQNGSQAPLHRRRPPRQLPKRHDSDRWGHAASPQVCPLQRV